MSALVDQQFFADDPAYRTVNVGKGFPIYNKLGKYPTKTGKYLKHWLERGYELVVSPTA
jgi:hypothetical protein